SLFALYLTALLGLCTLSLHAALPIYQSLDWLDLVLVLSTCSGSSAAVEGGAASASASAPVSVKPGNGARESRAIRARWVTNARGDRKSTRLNSSHVKISYAVLRLKKK